MQALERTLYRSVRRLAQHLDASAARRGALPHEHWETALSVTAAPNCAEAARSQCARALAAAAARSPKALDDALALGQRGGIASP